MDDSGPVRVPADRAKQRSAVRPASLVGSVPPPGRRICVRDGRQRIFGVDDREPVVLKAGDSFYEPPGALHAVSRNASEELRASMLAFFVLGEGESPTVYDGD
jgi:Cupin domain